MRGVLLRGVAGSTLLTLGGFCYDRVPRRTWMDRVSAVATVRSSSHPLATGLGLSAVGLVLLTWAWWDLRRGVRSGAVGVGGVRRAAAVWAIPLLVAPPLFSADGWSYVATGALTGQGRSPYLWTPDSLPVPLRSGVSPIWRLTPSPYGPLSLVWGGAFSRLTHDPWLLLASYRLLAVLALVGLAWAVPVLARRVGHDPAQASVLAVASPFVLVHGIGGLHNDLAMAALVCVALAVTRSGAWLPGALLVGAAAAVKAPGVVAVVGVTLLSLGAGAGWPARVWRSATVTAVAAGVVLAAGWVTGLGTGWISALSVPDQEYTVLSLPAVAGRWVRLVLDRGGAAGVRLAHDLHPEHLAKQIGVALLLVLAAWVLLRCRIGAARPALMGAATVLLAAVVLSPVVHYWYFFWCVPLLACLPLRRPANAALVGGVAMLGLTAIGDRALDLRWLWEGAAWALVLVPAAAWLLAVLRVPTGAASDGEQGAVTGPGASGVTV